MKTQSNLFEQMSKTEVILLTQTVKETLATDYNDKKQLSSADLWNIQRQKKYFRSRRGFA